MGLFLENFRKPKINPELLESLRWRRPASARRPTRSCSTQVYVIPWTHMAWNELFDALGAIECNFSRMATGRLKCLNNDKAHYITSSILDLLKIQPPHSTRSSAVVTLQRPSNPSRLKITDKSFYHQAPALWNSLPQYLRALSSTSSTQTNNPLLSLSSSQFHKQLKTYLFLQSYPP